MSLDFFELQRGSAVIVYLQAPKEKVWGLLVSIGAAGVCVRGLDIRVFDDWMRQEARGDEPLIGVGTLFYPMARVERLELDETIGPVPSYSARFAEHVGRSVEEVLGLGPAAANGSGSAHMGN